MSTLRQAGAMLAVWGCIALLAGAEEVRAQSPGGYQPGTLGLQGQPYYYEGGGYDAASSVGPGSLHHRSYHPPAVGGDPYTYHFGPGYYRRAEAGHYRFPYYSYRRPWYYVGPPSYNRDTNLPW